MRNKPTPPRTTSVVKTQLPDGSIVDAELTHYPRYASFLRVGACCIDLRIPQVGSFSKKSPDYFAALSELRRILEPRGIRLLCWGARKDVWPSGMQRDMGAGIKAYQLLDDGPEHTIFEYASPETIGTVDEQQANAKKWYESKCPPR